MPTSSGSSALPADPVPGRPDPALPLLLLHVPRTGGSTLKFLLQAVYGADRTLLDAHRYPTESLAAGFAVVEGHLGAGAFARHFGIDWTANGVTLLREPVARTVSQARHLRSRPGPLQEVLAGPVRDPDALFARVPRLADVQTKLLAGRDLDRPADDDALAAAIYALDRMAFAPTDALDAGIALVAERFGFGATTFGVRNAAASTGDDDLRSAAFRAAAAAHNNFDRRLFEHAGRLFAERCEHFTRTLLDAPLVSGAAVGAARYLRRPLTDTVIRPAPGVRGRISGWLLVDGNAPDVVVVRVGATVTPVVSRVHRDEAARASGRIANRQAGFVGTVDIPAEAETVEVIGIDRRRGRFATLAFAVVDAPRRPLLRRLGTGRKPRP